MPTACMKACTMVGPQKANPSALRALPIARETGVSVAIPARVRASVWIGRPSTKSQRKRAKPGPLSSIRSHARAPAMVPWILARLRMMRASAISRATSSSVKRAIRSGSKPAKAARNPSRRRRMVIHDRPAWKPSRISFS
jgi:hypothetical protein